MEGKGRSEQRCSRWLRGLRQDRRRGGVQRSISCEAARLRAGGESGGMLRCYSVKRNREGEKRCDDRPGSDCDCQWEDETLAELTLGISSLTIAAAA